MVSGLVFDVSNRPGVSTTATGRPPNVDVAYWQRTVPEPLPLLSSKIFLRRIELPRELLPEPVFPTRTTLISEITLKTRS